MIDTSRTFLGRLPIVKLLIIGILIQNTFSDVLSPSDGSVFQVRLTEFNSTLPTIQTVQIAASSRATFNITDVSSSASFFIFQIHAYRYNVTLSLEKDHLNKISNNSIFGTNIGLYFKKTKSTVIQLFAKNDNVHTVDALIVIIGYTDKAPIPGGCNMEFENEVAPYTKVYMRNSMIFVDIQPASVPLKNCLQLASAKNPVEHKIYHMFTYGQDTSLKKYFAAIENMLTVESIMNYGTEVLFSDVASPMRRVFNAYTGVGSVYAAVATYGGHSAAYVPAFSYACSPIIDPESCKVLTTGLSKILCAICFFGGLLSIFLGHKYLQIDMILPILFTATLFGYAVHNTILGVLVATGIIVLWGILFSISQTLRNLMFTLTLGILIANIVYYSTPDSFLLLKDNLVFWLFYWAVAIATALLTVGFTTLSFVITCSIFSSFMVILPLDYYLGSSLKYILINIVRRASIENFNLAVIEPPIQVIEIVLMSLWLVLASFRIYRNIQQRYTSYQVIN